MKPQDFTTADFHEYIIMQSLFRLKLWKCEKGFNAIVTKMPELGVFTRMKQLPHKEYQVFLSFEDIQKLEEPKSFFYGYLAR